MMGTVPDASGRGEHRVGAFHIRTKVSHSLAPVAFPLLDGSLPFAVFTAGGGSGGASGATGQRPRRHDGRLGQCA